MLHELEADSVFGFCDVHKASRCFKCVRKRSGFGAEFGIILEQEEAVFPALLHREYIPCYLLHIC